MDFGGFGTSVTALGTWTGTAWRTWPSGPAAMTRGFEWGAVFILRMHAGWDGQVGVPRSPGDQRGPTLADVNRFGTSVTALGDVDGTGVGGHGRRGHWRLYGGRVYVLRLNTDGTVKSSTKLASALAVTTLGGFDYFGTS